MNCARCEEMLFERSEGTLDELSSRRLTAHTETCARCAELATLLSATTLMEAPEEFTARIVGRTTNFDAIGAALRQLDRELPTMASMQPDDDFVGDVMRTTVDVRRRSVGYRLAAFWDQLVQRPRFALESAYVGALAIFLLVGLPGSPLAGAPQQAFNAVAGEQASLRTFATASAERVTAITQATWRTAGTLVDYAPDRLAVDEATATNRTWRQTLLGWVDRIRERLLAPAWRWISAPWRPSPDTDESPAVNNERGISDDRNRSST